MATLFTNPYKKAKVWSAQNVLITYGTDLQTAKNQPNTTDSSSQPFLFCKTFDMTYQRGQQIQYPIGGGSPIKLLGIPSGTFVINTLFGPTTDLDDFLKKFSSNCAPFYICIRLRSQALMGDAAQNCEGTAAKDQMITLKGCSGTVLRMTIQQGQGNLTLANGILQGSFTGADWT